MMSDNVTITELADGALVVQRIGLPDGVIYPEVAAAIREFFAAERMPEDVQALVDEARLWPRDGINEGPLINELAAALEAAYSKGAVDDPR